MNQLQPRTWRHVILQGDDEARLRELRAEAERLKPAGKRTDPSDGLLGESDPWAIYDDACQVANEFAAEAEDRGIEVLLRAVGRRKWRELVNAHPTREGNDEDKAAGFHVETFPEALVPACLASLGEKNFTDGQAADFLDAVTPAQFDLLAVAAYQLHTSLGADPKARIGSEHAAS